MNEAEARAEYIDPALVLAGRGVVEGSRIRREFGCRRHGRRMYCGISISCPYASKHEKKTRIFIHVTHDVISFP